MDEIDDPWLNAGKVVFDDGKQHAEKYAGQMAA
jgi:hypothetical protein